MEWSGRIAEKADFQSMSFNRLAHQPCSINDSYSLLIGLQQLLSDKDIAVESSGEGVGRVIFDAIIEDVELLYLSISTAFGANHRSPAVAFVFLAVSGLRIEINL